MRQVVLAAVLMAGVALGGCSGYDVELKGGVFDMLGVSDLNTKRTEPKMKDRAGLVIPPSTASLPAPGTGQSQQVAANGEAFPVNPEDRNKINKEEIVAKHRAFCEQARQRFEAGMTPTIENSPWGACHESILRNFSGRDLAGNKAVGAE